MTNNATAIKLWDEVTEIQAETLNGGTVATGASKYGFYGPVGPIQINEGDGVQINPGFNVQQFVKIRTPRFPRYH